PPGEAPDAAISSLVTGDFNNDGRTDLAVLDSRNGLVSIRLGLGDGTFAALPPVTGADGRLLRRDRFELPGRAAPDSVASLAVGDFNEDGRLHLAALTSRPGPRPVA